MSAPQLQAGSTPGQSSPGQLAAPYSEDGRFGSQGGQSPRQPTGDLEQPRWTPTPEATIHAAYPFQRTYPHFAPASPDFGPHQLAAMTLARPGMALADPTGMSYIAHPYIQADFRGYVPVQAFAADPRMAARGYEPAAFQPAMSPVLHHPRQRGGPGVGGHDQRYDGPSTDVAHNMQRDDGRGRWGGVGFQFPPQVDVSRSGAPYQAEYAQGGYDGQQGPPQSKSRFHDPRLSVWVGNVPPDTSSQELYNFFGDVDVESIYVVPKSRCAFLNLYNEDQVIDVVRRYHESVFRNGRILLRPQKESPRYAAAYRQDPSLGGGSSLGPASAQFRGSSRSPSNYLPSPAGTPGSTYQQLPGQPVVPQWSTQLKNAAALNEAFDMCETVYLAFSVNGSRSFFGYAM
ncbi:hypothetical protein M427DRAFT_396941 [Gonapodya prolifera JEL478]|uniref:YTH domain-containing protein n=1 Tax=Gonapodya prolifera (strain JEL478) TaxID=1344416 RepID=A0A139A6S4_GONPJ|nr:hypothetical protein M427DRAFT_396941 [Gonapodya prolifera JEL478]|eukprot:KXS12404.1 hypothetical protein M427DRAFT_396941 [Gonapodya prolifera JEL478]